MPNNSTPKNLLKKYSSISKQKLPVDDEKLSSVLKTLLESDSSLRHNAVAENLKPRPTMNEPNPSADITLIKQMVTDQNFVSGVVRELSELRLYNQDFTTAINLEIENKIKKEYVKLQEDYDKKFVKMHAEFEKLSQYSRRNCLIIHGIKTKNGLRTNEVCKKFFETNLGIKVEDYEIDRCHRLGKTTENASDDEDTSTKKSSHNQ